MTDSDRDLTPTTEAISPFDAIKHHDERGDYWSARELATLLGYKPNAWHNFGRWRRWMCQRRSTCQPLHSPFSRYGANWRGRSALKKRIALASGRS
jgi:hypothetical protein